MAIVSAVINREKTFSKVDLSLRSHGRWRGGGDAFFHQLP